MPAVPERTNCVTRIGDGLIAHGLYDDTPLRVIDSTGRVLDIIDIPEPYPGLTKLNESSFAWSPSKRRMVVVYRNARRMDFLNHDGMRYGSIQGPRPVQVLYTTVDHPDHDHVYFSQQSEVSYLAVAATKRFVYTLFSGLPAPHPGTQVQIYGWNGDFKAEYALDRGLLDLTVSEDDAVLYGAFFDPDGRQRIGEWRLPSVP